MQKLVFFDLDGTLIDDPSSEKLYILWLITHGYIRLKQIIRVVKFIYCWWNTLRIKVFFKNKAYLHDLPITETIQLAQQFTSAKLLPRLRPHVLKRLKQHQADGDIIILLTGAPTFIAEVFTQTLGITELQATEFTQNNGYFHDLPPLQHPFAEEKVTVAQKMCTKHRTKLEHSIAYANSIHDLRLLEKVGQAIAVTPDRKLRKIALQRNWEII